MEKACSFTKSLSPGGHMSTCRVYEPIYTVKNMYIQSYINVLNNKNNGGEQTKHTQKHNNIIQNPCTYADVLPKCPM